MNRKIKEVSPRNPGQSL